MAGSPLGCITQIFEEGLYSILSIFYRIIKTKRIIERPVITDTQFLIPFRSTNDFLFLQRVYRIHREANIRQIYTDVMQIVILTMICTHSKIERRSDPCFCIGNRRSQLILEIELRVIGNILIEFCRTSTYTRTEVCAWPG